MNRILVVLPNWYGETLFATPFLRSLRAQLQSAFIATLGWPQCREVLQHNPRVDELLTYDEHGSHKSLRGKYELVRLLKSRCFDSAFILRRSLSRSLLLAWAGIPNRVGFANVKSGWLLTRSAAHESIKLHKASSYLALLEAVGLNRLYGFYEYFVGEEEEDWATKLLNSQRLLDGRPIIILHPGANWLHKRWQPLRFAQLGDRLAESFSAHIVLSGSPADAALVQSIKDGMNQSAVVVAGKINLRQLGACIKRAHLVVANDTGVLHMAAALKRPIVALYGPTSPQLTGPLSDPSRSVVLHHPDCCPGIPCYKADHPSHPGMDAISVEEAYSAAASLLTQVYGSWKSDIGEDKPTHA